jgi:hypothetical protein
MSQRVCFYVGPSVPMPEFLAACQDIPAEVEVRPPVQQGDLLRSGDDRGVTVGIIDGFFFQVPSVLHKEILWAMQRGSHVLGAASLGALRAAELDAFGMEGVGTIYQWYRSGRIDADDEVAVMHGEASEGFQPLSEPLVNIRYNLHRARTRKVISARSSSRLLALSRNTHFAERSYRGLLDAATQSVPAAELQSLRDFLARDAVDLKRQDALLLVRTIADRLQGRTAWPAPPPSEPVSMTIYLHLFRKQYMDEELALAMWKLLDSCAAREVRRVALRCAALEQAHHLGIATETPATHLAERQLEARVLRTYRRLQPGVPPYAAILADLARRTGLCPADFLRSPRMRPGIPWDGPLERHLKFRGCFAQALELATRVVRSNQEIERTLPGFGQALAPAHLEAHFAARWGCQPETMPEAIMERGFATYADFVEAARVAYAFDVSTRRAPSPRTAAGTG